MTRWFLVPFIVAAAGIVVPGPYAFAEGVGATCWARPQSPSRYNPAINMCQTVGETQYPGINMLAAKAQIIQECINRNALDYGCAHEGGCCVPQCAEVAVCLYFTPNKSITDKEQ
jgi:hypothetical protein